eukprot:scaffold2715_cov170-Amphora_coffeaeformis.AAC.1
MDDTVSAFLMTSANFSLGVPWQIWCTCNYLAYYGLSTQRLLERPDDLLERPKAAVRPGAKDH